jgi:O-antigen ligase
MKKSVCWNDENEYEISTVKHHEHFSFLRFLTRYPIFLLAFGPPLFRSGAIDATKGVIDYWSFFQVGLLAAVAARAIYRLASSESILIPSQIRSILKMAFLLGLLFLASAVYSPSRLVAAAYSVFYFLTLICVVEFVADVYQEPPNWIQSLFHLRFIAILLVALAFLTLFFAPSLVVSTEGVAGLRMRGGSVAPVGLIGPVIAVISGFSFLHGLEPKVRASLLFLLGVMATLSSQGRGVELALLFSLLLLALGWAKTGRRSTLIFISGFMASILVSGILVGVVGGSRMWAIFNRGEATEGIVTASGRTQIWKFVIDYCIAHPQGMGYIVGFRTFFREYFALGLQVDVSRIGNSHNSFIDVLADAGWLALAIYLIMLVKIVLVGSRFAKNRTLVRQRSDVGPNHAIRCALVLLALCLAEGMSSADFSVPLRAVFYWQNVIVAMILGISARLIFASRTSHSNSID